MLVNVPHRTDHHLLAGAYALDAVDDLERRRFEHHLRSCAPCRDEVAGFRAAAAGLAIEAAEPFAPSLKAAVLAEIDRTAQVPAPSDEPVAAPVSELPWRRRTRGVLAGLGAVAAVAMMVVGVTTIHHRLTTRPTDDVAALVRATDTRVVRLAGSAGRAQLTFSPSVGAGLFVAEGLTPLDRDHTYELWLVEAGVPHAVATFRPDAAGGAEVRLPSSPPIGAVMAVTEEPGAGSPQPTSAPVLESDAV